MEDRQTDQQTDLGIKAPSRSLKLDQDKALLDKIQTIERQNRDNLGHYNLLSIFIMHPISYNVEGGGVPQRPSVAVLAMAPKRMYVLI